VAARATAAGVSQLLAYYNSIEGIRRAGGSRVDAWSEIQGIEAEGGPTVLGSTIFDMNEVWQRAGSVLNAEAGFARNQAEGAFTAEGWAWAPWAAQTVASGDMFNAQLRYQYEVTSPAGETQLFWGQTDWAGSPGALPSLDQLFTRVEGSASTSFDSYPAAYQEARGIDTGSSLGDVVAVQVLRV
jgi:hypothetical protein